MCLIDKTDKNIFFFFFGGGGGGYIFLCLLPYNSNFQYSEIKSVVPRISNLRNSTVIVSSNKLNILG